MKTRMTGRLALAACTVSMLVGCSGKVMLVSVTSTGFPGDGPSYNAAVSAHGNAVAFVSEATNLMDPKLLPADRSVGRNVYVRDLKSGTTELVSISDDGRSIDRQVVGTPDISADGRFVVWASDNTSLVDGDTNGRTDIFLRDRQDDRTIRISLGTVYDNGARTVESDGNSINPSISHDGTMIVFESDATNLVVGDTNGDSDVFIRSYIGAGSVITIPTDPNGIGITDRLSLRRVGSDYVQVDGDSREPDIGLTDYDARLANVVLQSDGNLDAYLTDTNGVTDIFHSYQGARFFGMTSSSYFTPTNGPSLHPAIGNQGLTLVYATDSTVLFGVEPADLNGVRDVIVRDMVPAGSGYNIFTTRVSVSESDVQANGPSDHPALSWEGRFVAFETEATNLDDDRTDPDVFTDIYLYNHETGKIMLVSRETIDTPGNGHSHNPSVSNQGWRVAFDSEATNLVESDTNGVRDVFVYQRFRGNCFWWHPFDFPFCVKGELE